MLAASGSGRHPAAAQRPVRLREALRLALEQGQRRMAGRALDRGAVTVPPAAGAGTEPFVNLNAPQDLVAAEALSRRGAP